MGWRLGLGRDLKQAVVSFYFQIGRVWKRRWQHVDKSQSSRCGPFCPLGGTSAALDTGMLVSPGTSAACTGFLLSVRWRGGAGGSGDGDGDEEEDDNNVSMARSNDLWERTWFLYHFIYSASFDSLRGPGTVVDSFFFFFFAMKKTDFLLKIQD